jgi:hypothetical protein
MLGNFSFGDTQMIEGANAKPTTGIGLFHFKTV